jgi:MFS family permease
MEGATSVNEVSISICSVLFVSLLLGLIGFSGPYFAYHTPGALEVSFQAEYGLSTLQFAYLFTAYAVPGLLGSTVMAGMAIKAYGIKRVGCVLLLVSACGSAVFAFGCSIRSFPLMLIGRFILGLGGEPIVTWGQEVCTHWFGGTQHESKSMGTMVGVQQFVGSWGSFFILESIAAHIGLDLAVWVSVATCIFSLLLLGVYCIAEYCFIDYLSNEMQKPVTVFPLLCCCFLAPSTVKQGCSSIEAQPSTSDIPEHQKLVEMIKGYQALFWLQSLVVFFLCPVMYTYANFLPAFCVAKYDMSAESAARLASSVYVLMPIAPLAGALVDKIGHKLHFQILTATGLLACISLLQFTNISPWALVLGSSFCFTFLEQNSIIVLLSASYNPELTSGMTLGIWGLCLNLGLLIIPALTGAVDTELQNFVSIGAVSAAVLCSVLMVWLDDKGDLNKSGVFNGTCTDITELPATTTATAMTAPANREAGLL